MADAKKSLRKKRGTAKVKFHRFLNTFAKKKEQADNIEVLKLMMADLESTYKDMEMKHQNYTELLDSEDEDDKQDVAEKEEDMERVYQELCAARTDYAKLDKNQKSSKVTKPSVTAHAKTTEQLKMKRLDALTFTGKIRDYPCFKNDFKNHVLLLMEKTHLL